MKRIMIASVLCMLMAGTVEAQTAKHVTSLGLIGTGIALVLTGDDEVDYMPSGLVPSTYDTGNLLPCATMPALDHTGPDFQRTCRIEGGQLTFIDWMRSGPPFVQRKRGFRRLDPSGLHQRDLHRIDAEPSEQQQSENLGDRPGRRRRRGPVCLEVRAAGPRLSRRVLCPSVDWLVAFTPQYSSVRTLSASPASISAASAPSI